jgi:hypothetical protein
VGVVVVGVVVVGVVVVGVVVVGVGVGLDGGLDGGEDVDGVGVEPPGLVVSDGPGVLGCWLGRGL